MHAGLARPVHVTKTLEPTQEVSDPRCQEVVVVHTELLSQQEQLQRLASKVAANAAALMAQCVQANATVSSCAEEKLARPPGVFAKAPAVAGMLASCVPLGSML
jgi:hypothetical protein